MFLKRHKKISAETLIDLKRYIDLCYPQPVEREGFTGLEDSEDFAGAMPPMLAPSQTSESCAGRSVNKKSARIAPAPYAAASLSDALNHLDESFFISVSVRCGVVHFLAPANLLLHWYTTRLYLSLLRQTLEPNQ